MMIDAPPLPRRRVAVICIGLALLLAWNVALASRRRYYKGHVVTVERQDVQLTASCPSKIEPRVQATIQSLVRGKKQKVLVVEGDAVHKGQLLMEISDDDVRRELKQKRIQLENASSDAKKAAKDLALSRTLFRKGAVSSREVDDAEQTLRRTRQVLGAASEEMAASEKKSSGVHVTSPLDGMVLSILSTRDDIQEGQDIFVIAQTNDYIVRGSVDELDLARVRVGQDVAIRCEAFRNVEMAGKVEWIGPQAKDGVFAEVEVRIILTDSKGVQLRPNLSCEGRIITGKMPHALVIPANGVRRGPNGTFVLKAEVGGWLKTQPVTLAAMSEGLAIIGDGLAEKDSVLVPEEQ